MRKCIFCKKEKLTEEFNKEHVFPKAIGGTFVIYSVCKECHDKIGSLVDKHLVDHWFIICERNRYGLKGQSKKVPTPFTGIHTLGENPEHRVKCVFDRLGKPTKVKTIPRLEINIDDSGKVLISGNFDTEDREKIPEMINKALRRRGLPEQPEDELRKNLKEYSQPSPWIHIETMVDAKKFKKGIVKIAYELAWHWLGENYLDDKVGVMIRHYLFNDPLHDDRSDKYPIWGSIKLIGKESLMPIWDYDMTSHIAYMMVTSNGKIGCYVRIFRTFEGLIQISDNPTRYPDFRGKFIANNPVDGSIRETDLNEEFVRIAKMVE